MPLVIPIAGRSLATEIAASNTAGFRGVLAGGRLLNASGAGHELVCGIGFGSKITGFAVRYRSTETVLNLATGKYQTITKTEIMFGKRYLLGQQLMQSFLKGDSNKANQPLHGGLMGLHNIFKTNLANHANTLRPSIEIDATEFNKALFEYMKYSKKTAVEVVNTKAMFCAISAMKETYKADPKQIRADMDKASNWKGLTMAEMLTILKFRKEKRKFASKAEFKKEVRKLKMGRIRASAFLKSGWLPAIKIMSRVADKNQGYFGEGRGKKIKGKTPLGGAKPALAFVQRNYVFSEIWNSIVADNDSKVQKYKIEGLNKALAKEAANMMQYVARKQQENTNKFNQGKI